MSQKKPEKKQENNLPFVSVVIPAHNEEGRVGMTLDLLKRQTYPQDKFEVIVVDNNSTDRTAEVAQASGAQVIKEHRPGVAWAREAGWKVARGEIILSTDADVQPPDNWVEQMVNRFRQHPELVGLTGGLRFFDKPWWFNGFAILLNPFLVYLGFLMSRGVYNFTGNNMAARKWVYEKVGGFNTGLHFGEDMDLARRIKQFGKIRFYPGLVMWCSGRRYTFDLAFWRYFVNYLWTSLFAHPRYNELPKVK